MRSGSSQQAWFSGSNSQYAAVDKNFARYFLEQRPPECSAGLLAGRGETENQYVEKSKLAGGV